MVQRYSLSHLPGFSFERRPVSDAPASGTLCFVDDGDASGWTRRPCVALFDNGEWTNGNGRALPFAPTYWTEMWGPRDA